MIVIIRAAIRTATQDEVLAKSSTTDSYRREGYLQIWRM